jgi:hypothetical protein
MSAAPKGRKEVQVAGGAERQERCTFFWSRALRLQSGCAVEAREGASMNWTHNPIDNHGRRKVIHIV